MAGSCEISNILSKYNSTMYQQEEPQLALDVLGHPGDDGSLGLSFPQSLPPVDTTGRMGRSGGGVFGGAPMEGRSEAALEEHPRSQGGRWMVCTVPQFPQGGVGWKGARGCAGWHQVPGP